jgi:NADH:ubiquinone reductase (H+-translocating)
MNESAPGPKIPHIVIIGGGFGGLYAAKSLGNKPVRVTLIDRRNFHLFQPLLYQIATGSLSLGEIASPLRTVLSKYRNIEVLMDEVIDINPQNKHLVLKGEKETLSYDILIVATGGITHYFGNDHWKNHTQGLKSVEEALDMRRQIFSTFEAAEKEKDPVKQMELTTFVIIGGGPTGVELAGALAELSRLSLPQDFHHIQCEQARIILIDMGPRVLGVYPEDLSQKASETLTRLGVTIRTNTSVTDIQDQSLTVSHNGHTETINAATILWAAGVKASPLGQIMAEKLGCQLDRGGRVIVESDLSLREHPEIFVIGDLANFSHTPDQKPLPGVAPVAIQQGEYVARLILNKQQARVLNQTFRYKNKGNLAVIGVKEAVADLNKFHLSGFFAWLIWAVVHISYLIEFDHKLMVMFQWAWTLSTRRHGARLITGKGSYD